MIRLHTFVAHLKSTNRWILLTECCNCFSLVQYQGQQHNCPDAENFAHIDNLPIQYILNDADIIYKLS